MSHWDCIPKPHFEKGCIWRQICTTAHADMAKAALNPTVVELIKACQEALPTQVALQTPNSLPHPSSCLKTPLLWACRCKHDQNRAKFMRYHADALNHPWLQSPSPLLTSPSVWSSSSESPATGPLTPTICDSLWFRGCHCSSWTSYEHVCSTGNPHSMTEHSKHRKFSRASTKKEQKQNNPWWCK